ncbi:MAG: alpha/beta fold hydrolase [Rhodococcus sp. (in: high G+C Gram-positive bacteria)]
MSHIDTSAKPRLRGLRSGLADGAVLVLHGGKVTSFDRARPWQLSALRMVPFTRMLRRTLGDSTAVAQLQYRYRGWNGADRSPVSDALWACEHILEAYGPDTPITLLGHSMGGRTAAAVAGHPNVVAVIGLAPWWPDGTETATMRAGQKLLVVHGTADRWTDPVASRAATESAAARGVDAQFVPVAGAGHFMIRSSGAFSEQVHRFAVDQSREVSTTKPE